MNTANQNMKSPNGLWGKVFPWLILVAALALWDMKCNAQVIGMNGAGFFENYSIEADEYLAELGPFALRLPGGAISKFADPYNYRSGWGMTEENIQTWFDSTGFDEDGSGLDKWLRKASDQPDRSYMDDLADLQVKFPEMQIIWVLNVMNSTPEANLNALRYMIGRGVNITVVEAGNEVYGKYANFEEYRQDFEPLFNQIAVEFPDIKKSICLAPTDRREYTAWNNAIKSYHGNYDMGTLHFYLSEKYIPQSFALLPEKKVIDYSAPDAELTACFNQYLYDSRSHFNTLDSIISICQGFIPGKEVIITEFNCKPSEAFCGTLANANYIFNQTSNQRYKVGYLCIHNGIGPDHYPIIGRKLKQDLTDKNLIRRPEYFALQLSQSLYYQNVDTLDYVFTFDNLGGDAYTPATNFDSTFRLDSVIIFYLTGQYLYSSSGAIGLMNKNQPPTAPEITGISIQKGSEIPANAFGYIIYYHSLAAPPDPVLCPRKCKKFFYRLFHPELCACYNKG